MRRMLTRQGSILVGASLTIAVLAGCSGESSGQPASDKDSAPKVTQSEKADPPSDDAIKPYVEGIASSDLGDLRGAQRAALDGSLAEAYAQHQANQAEAVLDGGGEPGKAGDISEQGSGFKVCYPDEGSSPCYVYDDFALAPSGEVADFTIDKRPLRGRLIVGDGSKATSPLGDITLLSAYYTQSGYLSIATRVRTKDEPIYIHDAAASYRAPNGRQRGQSSLDGPQEIGARSRSSVVFYFRGPIPFGGTMTVELNQKDNNTDPELLTLTIK